LSNEIDYSKLRKKWQKEGEAPDWYTTGGVQLFAQKYAYQGETVKSRMSTIAKAMAKHAPNTYPDWWDNHPYFGGKNWEQAFFQIMWDGFASPSTPLMANGGLRKRGTTVSCAGGYVGNNLFDRYDAITEAAVLTKHSHGTSYSIDAWPAEGEKLKRGGRSLGTMPMIRDFVQAMEEVTQGSRRGSLAYSIGIEHGDFYRVLDNLYKNTESNNVGWLVTDSFNDKLKAGDPEAIKKMSESLDVKLMRGKGYYTFIDKMNRHRAEAFKRAGLNIQASNLCQEVVLPANEDYTFSCVILNENLERWYSRPDNLMFVITVMSDCNVSEYLETIAEMSPQDQLAMRKIKRFTEEFRALGSGVLGFHTLLQQARVPVASMEAIYLNDDIFSTLGRESLAATQWLATVLGEPLGCKGLGIRNATRLMMPPTKSTAELMAGASEGIGLDTAMVFTKQSAGGELFRVNKVLLEIMKERGKHNKRVLRRIAEKRSVQQEDWLTDHEKAVFQTAFETDMFAYLRLCSQRQPNIDQGQSINTYFSGADSEEYISNVHRWAFEDEGTLALYYIYSMRDSGEVQRITECETCQ
jgi:ribonucleoside-diphosphate reductase alpha chain